MNKSNGRKDPVLILHSSLSGAIPGDCAVGDVIVNVVHIGWKALIC